MIETHKGGSIGIPENENYQSRRCITVDELNYEQRLTRTEERSKSNTHRLDKLEPIVEEIHNMSETLVEITSEMKHTNSTVNSINEKVEKLEQEPGDRWKNSTRAVLNAILGAIGAAIAAGIFWAIAQTIT